MRIWVFLADYAQAQVGQKINAIGLGWARTGTPLPAFSVVVMFEAMPNEPALPEKLIVRLVDSSGTIVSDTSDKPIEAELALEASRDPVLSPVPGITAVALAVTPGLPLKPGIYRWEVTSPDFPDERWERPFAVLALPFGAASEEQQEGTSVTTD